MSITMRAKFIVNEVQEHFSDEAKTVKVAETLYMAPVAKSDGYPEDGHDDDNTFARWSPSGSLTLYVANPNLWGKYAVGSKHYLDFTSAEPVPAVELIEDLPKCEPLPEKEN